MRVQVACLVGILAAAPLASVAGQPAITPGQWVRVIVLVDGRFDTIDGTVSQLDSTALTLAAKNSGTRVIPLGAVIGIERGKPVKLTWRLLDAGINTAMFLTGGRGTGTAVAATALTGVAGAVAGSQISRMRFKRVPVRTIRRDVMPGTLVRLKTRSRQKWLGQVVAVEADSFAVYLPADSTTRWIRRAELAKLEWPTGVRRSSNEGALAGALVGLAVGGVAAAAHNCSYDDWLGLCGLGRLALVASATEAGALVGSAIGYLSKHLVWERVPLTR